jgi:hypothetical protein
VLINDRYETEGIKIKKQDYSRTEAISRKQSVQQHPINRLEQSFAEFLPEAFGRVVWALCLLRGGNTLSSHVRKRGGQESSYQTTHSNKVHLFWSPDFGLLRDLPEHVKTDEQRYVDVCEIRSIKISCNREYTRTASEEGGG